MPASRFQTRLRTYPGSLRSFHSWTQASLQKVRRGGRTGSRHQRQIGSPAAFSSGFPQSSAETALRRTVLTEGLSVEEPPRL
jgi:hypothetical protein